MEVYFPIILFSPLFQFHFHLSVLSLHHWRQFSGRDVSWIWCNYVAKPDIICNLNMIWTKIVKLSRRGKSLELGLDTEADVPGGNTMYAPMVKPSDVPYVAQSHHHTVQAYPDICAPDDSTYNIAAGIVI